MESKLSAGQSALEAERSRRAELEQQQRQLQELLEEERQAKRDEEIVRNLQARWVQVQYFENETCSLPDKQKPGIRLPWFHTIV